MNFSDRAVIFFATGCFTGKIPFGPGTFGTIAGLPFCFLLSRVSVYSACLWATVFIVVSIWIAHHAQKIIGEKDPGCIVIDEMAGVIVAFLGLPFTMPYIITGFICFRILDIWKPHPIGFLDRKLSGGTGIVLDDLAAGIFTNLVLRVVFFLFNF